MSAEPADGSAGGTTDRLPVLLGSLVVAGLAFAAAVRWLVDKSSAPGTTLLVLVTVAAIAAMVASAFAEPGAAARRRWTREVGNITRLVSLVALLLVIPSILISFTDDEEPDPVRAIDDACPEGIPGSVFADVRSGTQHARAINCLVRWEVFSDEPDTFEPGASVPREQVAATVARFVEAAGAPLPEAGAPSPFTDVSPESSDAVARVAASGLMGGTSDTTFTPAGEISRGQMATMAARLYEHVAGAPVPGGTDDDEGPGRPTDIQGVVHADNIVAVVRAGIMTAPDGEFGPATTVTRGELATVLARTLDVLVAEGATDAL